jgi:hypothetical protein
LTRKERQEINGIGSIPRAKGVRGEREKRFKPLTPQERPRDVKEKKNAS